MFYLHNDMKKLQPCTLAGLQNKVMWMGLPQQAYRSFVFYGAAKII